MGRRHGHDARSWPWRMGPAGVALFLGCALWLAGVGCARMAGSSTREAGGDARGRGIDADSLAPRSPGQPVRALVDTTDTRGALVHRDRPGGTLLDRASPVLTPLPAHAAATTASEGTPPPRPAEGPNTGERGAPEVLTDFHDEAPDPRQLWIGLRFKAIRPLPNGQAGDVAVMLRWSDGAWIAEAHRAAADYNQKSPNTADASGLTWDGERLRGALRVGIGTDKPIPYDRKNRLGFPKPADQFTIRLDARRVPGETLPYQEDTEASMPPWRKDMPRYGGRMLKGTYQATRVENGTGKAAAGESGPVQGAVLGGVSPAATPGHFGVEGNALLSMGAKGLELTARLSPGRVGPPESAFAVLPFPEAKDWSDYRGLRITVATPKRRNDAAVALRIREASGAWYEVTSAGLLLDAARDGVAFDVPFEDFRAVGNDLNLNLDLDAIDALAMGVNNPHGVGDVSFSVRSLALLPAIPEPAAAVVRIHPAPRAAINLNGVEMLPKGLFGFHDVWAGRGIDYKNLDPVEYLALVKPGYLRPLDHVGFHGPRPSRKNGAKRKGGGHETKQRPPAWKDPTSLFHRRAVAGDAADEIVWCHTTELLARAPWMDQDREPFLKGVADFYRHLASQAWRPGQDDNLLRRLEVWNEPFMWARHFNAGHRAPKGKRVWDDPTQYSDQPGQGIANIYADIFLAASAAAKEANPNVQLGGPCSMPFSWDGYATWTEFVAPVLDRTHQEIDFLTEHHYDGSPLEYAASYEVATAWCDVKYGRRIPIYNTECNILQAKDERRRFYYNVRDILEMARFCPDKVRGRALHALWKGFPNHVGDNLAYVFLAPLRGRITPVHVSDPRLVAVASRPDDKTLVVVAINPTGEERTVALAGKDGDTPWRVARRTLVRPPAGSPTKMQLATTTPGTPYGAAQDALTLATTLPPLAAVCYELTCETGAAPIRTRRRQVQHFIDACFATVTPGKPVRGRILWRGPGREGATRAKRAWLRLVTRDVHRGEGLAAVGGTNLPLPWSSSNDRATEVQLVPIDPRDLQNLEAVSFGVTNPKRWNGYTIYSASILVEYEAR